MNLRPAVAHLFLLSFSIPFALAAAPAGAAGEYAKHFGALERLSVAVAQAMPADD